MSRTLDDLVQSAQGGDRAAFAELYSRYVRMVHGIVRARVAHLDVDDLVQDVFMVAMQQLPLLRNRAAFGGWLCTIARNRATSHHRRRPPDSGIEPDTLPGAGGDGLEALAVMAAIRSLPDAYRETLTLRLVEGLTGSEIAACAGLTEGSVRVNLHRGLKLLRERLERRSA